uniref:C2H2-type domain-containing protein n=1 Tax=Plectus sambesii TaxID=2011161 RepID=A0A914X9V9_9BILA
VSKFTSNEREKLALQRALASLNADDNAIVKTSTKPFGVKACDRHGATSSDSEQRNASCVPRLNLSQAARNSNGDEKRDWSCGLCRFIRVKFSDINPTIQAKKTDSFYDCFECNRSFCLQSELTTHICQVH